MSWVDDIIFNLHQALSTALCEVKPWHGSLLPDAIKVCLDRSTTWHAGTHWAPLEKTSTALRFISWVLRIDGNSEISFDRTSSMSIMFHFYAKKCNVLIVNELFHLLLTISSILSQLFLIFFWILPKLLLVRVHRFYFSLDLPLHFSSTYYNRNSQKMVACFSVTPLKAGMQVCWDLPADSWFIIFFVSTK